MKPYYFVKVTVNGELFGDADPVDEFELAKIVGNETCDKAIYEILYGTGAYTETRVDGESGDVCQLFVTTSEWTEA